MDQIANALRPVGLADNTKSGVPFHCGGCQYFKRIGIEMFGRCKNKHPKLFDRKVNDHWCCNLYDHPGMKVIIK